MSYQGGNKSSEDEFEPFHVLGSFPAEGHEVLGGPVHLHGRRLLASGLENSVDIGPELAREKKEARFKSNSTAPSLFPNSKFPDLTISPIKAPKVSR